MPLQNRVTPFGQLEAVNAKGAWLGNRGILHNEKKEIVAPWRHKNWVLCQLQFKDRKRTIFGKGTYSELFFLDEATAFAAGHRPCFTCRRERYKAFKDIWIAANAKRLGLEQPTIDDIDKVLHSERAIRGGGKVTFRAQLNELPLGTMIDIDGRPHLIWENTLHKWTHQGYEPPEPLCSNQYVVDVLTPASVVAMYRLGFRPETHASL